MKFVKQHASNTDDAEAYNALIHDGKGCGKGYARSEDPIQIGIQIGGAGGDNKHAHYNQAVQPGDRMRNRLLYHSHIEIVVVDGLL